MAAIAPGTKVPAFSLPATDGKTYASDSLLADARALAVVFTCNHCPYAQAWEGRINNLAQEYGAKGVRLVAVSANDAKKYPADGFDKMKERAEQKKFVFPYLYDESQAVAQAFGATRTPEVFIFDAEGVLRYHGAPDDNYEDENAVKQSYARDAIEAVLNGQQIAAAQTPPVGCTIKWK
jgi:peroxiredoxin